MNSSHTIVIRQATAADADTLDHLAALDSRRPLTGAAMIAEVDGIARVALDLHDGSVAADPFAHTAKLIELLKAPLIGPERTATARPLRVGLRARMAAWSWDGRGAARLRPWFG